MQRKDNQRRGGVLGALGALGAVVGLAGQAQAQNLVNYSRADAIDGVAEVRVNSDGSATLVLDNGRSVVIPASDVQVRDGVAFINNDALAALDADGGFLSNNALLLGAAGVAIAGGAGAAIALSDDDDDNGGAQIVDDTFVVNAVTDGDVIDGGDDNNGATATSAADIATGDTIDLSGLSEGVSVDLDASNQGALNNAPESQEGVLTQGDATVTLTDIENVIGTDQNDTLFGNNEANVIIGGDGDDNIHPFGGTDFADGGAGSDTLNLSAATGVTVDLAAGTAGPNTFVNFENVLGSVNGDDTILGDANVNVLNGREGNDLLDGRGGADTLIGGGGNDVFAFSGDPFDGADVSAADRQIIGNEDTIEDFNFAEDTYQFNAGDFGITGDVSFAAVDANDPNAQIPAGANVIVLLNSDNDADPGTPFLAGTAAGQIANLVDQPGPGIFVYFNSNLQLNRVVYSSDLSDPTADLSILSRQTDLTGQDAIDALASFSADNFQFVNVQDAVDDTFVVNAVTDGDVIDGGDDNNGATATSAADIATGDTIDLSGLSEGVSVDLDASNQGALNNAPESQEGVLTQGDATVTLTDIENVIGTDQNDTLFGNNEANVIIGGDGDDNIHPFGGTDFADGGAGSDTLNLSAATGVTVDLAAGTAGPNTFVNFENVLGSVNGDDTILGDANVNVLNGREGNDLLDGRGGADTLIGGGGNDVFAFSGDPFDGADVSAADRQIIGNEDTIEDFNFAEDTYQFNAGDFGITGDVSFAAVDANDPNAQIPAGANVIVLLNSDNDADPGTPFLAGTAAGQIANLVDQPGPGIFVYFNSNLQLNRVVYSSDLSDPTADLSILSRQTDLTGQDAIDALASFSADNFQFVNVQDAPAVTFNEASDGDLSGDPANPTSLALGLGTNEVTATQQGDAEPGGRDIDYVSFTVAEGQELTEIVIADYQAGAGNLAFLGLQEGPVSTVDPANPSAADLLGGITYGSGDVGGNVLGTIGTLPGAIGFEGSLPAGTYTLWLNQTGPASTVTVQLVTQPVASQTGSFGGGFVDLSDDVDSANQADASDDGAAADADAVAFDALDELAATPVDTSDGL